MSTVSRQPHTKILTFMHGSPGSLHLPVMSPSSPAWAALAKILVRLWCLCTCRPAPSVLSGAVHVGSRSPVYRSHHTSQCYSCCPLRDPCLCPVWLRPQLPHPHFPFLPSQWVQPLSRSAPSPRLTLVTSVSPTITSDLSTRVLREWPAPTNSCTHWFWLTGGPGRRSEKEIEAWI